ncbi:MAG TPA: spondin domain-containing protein [Bauldia sp.]|nr:spondin domain-containing protein [Bauldia sp.]
MLKTIAAAALMSAAAVPAFAAETKPMQPDAMGANAMSAPDAMGGDAMAAPGMMMGGKVVQITIQNLLTGQPFSPSFFESRAKDGAPLFKLGGKADDSLVAVAEGGNIGNYSVGAAKDMGQALGDAVLAIHALPGQSRTVTIHVDEKHPVVDGVWMLGNTNDGFSGFTGFDAYDLTMPMTLEVRGYDAGSEKNSEKKGYLGALGGGNMRDPENGVITYHAGIRGDADAPKDWNWDVSKPVAKITITPVMTAGG